MAGYAHYALHKLKIMPGDFAELGLEEKAFILIQKLKMRKRKCRK